MTETHFSLLDLDGPTKRDLCLSPVLLWPVGLSSLLSCERRNKIVLPSAVNFAFCSFFLFFFSLSTEESSVVLLCMYCWPACKVSSSIRPLVRLFYDCTLSGKALSTGVLPLSVLYRLAKVGLSDEVRAQALVLHLHYSFLREQIPRHVGPFHCASYSFHYRGLARPVESRLGSLGAQASQ